MEITPMVKTSYQINGLSKGCLGITYYFVSTKTVATGGKKPVAEYGPFNPFATAQPIVVQPIIPANYKSTASAFISIYIS